MVKNKSHVVFNEQAVVNACRRALEGDRDIYGRRFYVRRLFIIKKGKVAAFAVYDGKLDVNFRVEKDGHNWTVWEM